MQSIFCAFQPWFRHNLTTPSAHMPSDRNELSIDYARAPGFETMEIFHQNSTRASKDCKTLTKKNREGKKLSSKYVKIIAGGKLKVHQKKLFSFDDKIKLYFFSFHFPMKKVCFVNFRRFQKTLWENVCFNCFRSSLLQENLTQMLAHDGQEHVFTHDHRLRCGRERWEKKNNSCKTSSTDAIRKQSNRERL